MYILISLFILITGILLLPLSLRISLKETNTYIDTEFCIMLFKYPLYMKRRHDDCLQLIFTLLQRSHRSDSVKQKYDRSLLIIFLLLHIGRWKKIVWHAELGLDTASQTAIITGILQGIQGLLRESLRRRISCTTDMHCKPSFTKSAVKNEIICIVAFRPGNIIKEIVGRYLKSKWREKHEGAFY